MAYLESDQYTEDPTEATIVQRAHVPGFQTVFRFFASFCTDHISPQLNFIAHCTKKGNLHFSHVLEESLLGKYLVIYPLKAKNRNSIFQKTPYLKKSWTDPG